MEVSSLYSNFVVTPPVSTAPATATAGAAATILPLGAQSVAPIVGSSSSTASNGQGSPGTQSQSQPSDVPGQSATLARFTRDGSTNALVFVEIDAQTQTVIVQIPDEQLLKLRTYVAEMQRREEAAQQASPGSRVAKTM